MRAKNWLIVLLALLMLSSSVGTLAEAAQNTVQTYTWFIPDTYAQIPPNDAVVMKQIADLYGVRFERLIPPAEPLERLNIMLATGDLPDLISFDDVTVMEQYKAAGKLLRLNDYLEKYCPEVVSKNFRHIYDRLKDENGDIYYLPQGYNAGDADDVMAESMTSLTVRTSIFEDSNYTNIPKTLQEYHDLLPLVKEKYPGMAPVALALGAQGQLNDLIDISAGVWGLVEADDIVLEDGKLIYFAEHPKVKEFFRFLNNLSLEGYLDIESPILSREMLKQKCVSGQVWSFFGESWEIKGEVIAYEADNGSLEQMVSLFPKADETVEKVTYTRSPHNLFATGLALTTACENPEKFFEFYAQSNTEEGRLNVLGTTNWHFTGDNTPENTEGYVFIVREDKIQDGLPKVEFTEWCAEQWGSDENWWWNFGVELMYEFTYVTGQLPDAKYHIIEDDVSMWWDENTTRIFSAMGWTGKNYFPIQREMWADTSEFAALHIDPTSNEYAIHLALTSTVEKLLPRTIMATSPAEFDAAWDTLVQELKNDGLETYMTKTQELYEKRIAIWNQ